MSEDTQVTHLKQLLVSANEEISILRKRLTQDESALDDAMQSWKKSIIERKALEKKYNHLRGLAQMAMNLSSAASDDEILACIANTWDEGDEALLLLQEAEKSCLNPVAMKIRWLLRRLESRVKMMERANREYDE